MDKHYLCSLQFFVYCVYTLDVSENVLTSAGNDNHPH